MWETGCGCARFLQRVSSYNGVVVPGPAHEQEQVRRLHGGASLLFAFFGILCILMGAGVIEPEQEGGPVGLVGRAVMFLLGLGLLAGSVRWLAQVARHVVDEVVPGGDPFYWRLAVFLGRRVSARSVGAALGYSSLVADYGLLLAFGHTLPLTSREGLIELLSIEFLAIHATPFVAFLVLMQPESRWVSRARYPAVALTLATYGILAWTEASAAMALGFAYLMLAKLAPLALRPTAATVRAFVLRWGSQFLLFILCVGAFGDPSLKGAQNIPAGLAYFALLAMLELFDAFAQRSEPESHRGKRVRGAEVTQPFTPVVHGTDGMEGERRTARKPLGGKS
jgi:hypothetical protein